jgi:hypothetical protein
LLDNSLPPLKDEISVSSVNNPVLEYVNEKNFREYLRDDDEPGIVLLNDLPEVSEEEIKEKSWGSALILHGKWRS